MGYILLVLFLIIVYVYIGYPILLMILNLKRKSIYIKDDFMPTVTLFIPVYNEEKIIKEKISNSLALDYPKEKLQIVVASDGSNDNSVNIVRNFLREGITLFTSVKRRGKNSVINEYLPRCNGELIVFTDADVVFNRDAIKKLVGNFNDMSVGCVVGILRYADEKTSIGKGAGLYTRYESIIRKLEGRLGTLVVATGAIYAIRKELFIPLDMDVPNDFAHPIQIAAMGYKIVFEVEARAYGKASSSASDEFKRRRRIVTRGLTAFVRYWRQYHMLRGMWGFCFISHKLLRWFIPFFLIVIFLSNIFLHSPFFRFTLYSQVGFYFIALAGIFFKRRLGRFFSVPFYFCVINFAAFIGVLRYFGGKRQVIWDVAKTTR